MSETRSCFLHGDYTGRDACPGCQRLDLEFCPRCGSGPRQKADTTECPDCGYKWSGPRLRDLVENDERKKRLPMTELPTLAEIEQALANFNAAVDKEDVLSGTVYAAVCTGVLERIRDALRSGAYVIVRREDAEEAIAAMIQSRAAHVLFERSGLGTYLDSADEDHAVARKLLHLDQEPS